MGINSQKWLSLFFLILLGGCGSKAANDEFAQEGAVELTEVHLGDYNVTVDIDSEFEGRKILLNGQLSFSLFATVDEKNRKRLEKLILQRKGTFDDRVIAICRDTKLPDLRDPNLTVIRSKMKEMVELLFENTYIDSFVFSEIDFFT
ncbi:MAG: hypothetical protein MPJ24_02350 [Pirellulaceae bacterium]|nr:hypothetical protein [Pirellulaceae bacterium]